jgi:hypothetical protein
MTEDDIVPLALLAAVFILAAGFLAEYLWPSYGHLNAVLHALGAGL